MFDSFFLGGFECATGFNREGEWIDLVSSTWHDQHVRDDYRRLREVGIRAARDAIRWPLVDRGGGRYDFRSVLPVLEAALGHRVTVIWDLFHYGYPVGMDLLSPAFTERFEIIILGLRRIFKRFANTAAIVVGALFVMLVQTVNVWIWATTFYLVGAFSQFEPALYFSLVSFSTVGFGDITLSHEWRLLSGLTAAAGFLSFGWSTAYMVELVRRTA